MFSVSYEQRLNKHLNIEHIIRHCTSNGRIVMNEINAWFSPRTKKTIEKYCVDEREYYSGYL
jgi:methionyl-tRNA synthetase